MAPNNGGIWSWGDEILIMYATGNHRTSTACSSHSANIETSGATFNTSRSLDGGMTWNDHRVAFKRYTSACGWPNPQPVALATPLNFRDDSTIVNFQYDGTGKTYMYVSKDRGANWTGPYNNVPKFLSGISGRTNYEVTGPSSLTAYMQILTSNTSTCYREDSYAVHTTDGGLTWTMGAKISSLPICGSGKKYEWDTHPSVARIDSTTLIASFRSGNQTSSADRTGWFDVTQSSDNGKTWTHLTKLDDSPGNNSCPTTTQVVTLQDGTRRIVTLMWLRPRDSKACEKSVLFARTSDDKGKTWSNQVILRQDAYGWDTGYPISTVRPDGKIVVCYWIKTLNQDEPNYIAATIVDVGGVSTSVPNIRNPFGSESQNQKFELYPNPANGSLIHIKLHNYPENNIVSISIYSIDGAVVYQSDQWAKDIIAITPNLEKGMYLIEVNEMMQKLVVQ